jgi:hypothetical protein
MTQADVTEPTWHSAAESSDDEDDDEDDCDAVDCDEVDDDADALGVDGDGSMAATACQSMRALSACEFTCTNIASMRR